jgi:hypothetical protein
MKPINLDNSSCNPISSNCVIWQGPNIPCIKLCTGDSVTDVVYALATELCTIIDQVNISTLDLSCLDIITGTPTNINQLLQILIDKICELNNVSTTTPKRGGSSCPTDCIVPVASCLQIDGQTTMKLLDYVQLIGNKICLLLDSISTINSSLTDLTNRVIELESVPPTPPFVLPSVVPDCTLADGSVVEGVSYPLNIILTALINDDNHGYCALLGATGQPSQIETAYSTAPINGSAISYTNCTLTLEQYFASSWFDSPNNLSQSFTNLWLVVQDLRDSYKRYDVVAGNSNVTVTSTTTPGICPDLITYSVKAKSVSVVAGANVESVTAVVTGDNTEYTINVVDPLQGKSGRGIAVFSMSTEPNQANFDADYAGKEGFTVNFIPGNNQILPGDIWIIPCTP